MAVDRVRVTMDEGGLRGLSGSDDAREFLMRAAEPIVTRAQALAPKRSGLGAASIRSEPVQDEFRRWTVRVSWTRDRYYMYFHDRGTVRLRGTEFLERALEGALR